MGSTIQFRDAAAPSDPDSSLLARFENTISTPIVSPITWLANGGAIAGDYTIAATGANTVNVTPQDSRNPYTLSGKTVVADGVTVNTDVIPGVGIIFSASMATGWTAKLSIGALMAGDGSTLQRLNTGTVESDTMSTQRKHSAFNVGSDTSTTTAVWALPGLFVGGVDVDEYVAFVKNHTSPSRHAITSPGDYVLTLADYQNLAIDTADLWVNKDGGGAVKCIEDMALDETMYQFGVSGYIDGNDALPGMAISMFANGDPTLKTFTIYVREADDWIEFAPDVTGSPGTWQAGPLTLTQIGQASGTILAAGYCDFWTRVVVPESASPGLIRLAMLRSRGLTV